MAKAVRNIYEDHKASTIPPAYGDLDEPSFYIQPMDMSQIALSKNVSQDRLVLINFSPGTDWTGLRRAIWIKYCTRKRRMIFDFGRCLGKPYGVQINDLTLIYRRNRQYPFWLSPRGNGIDCHRTWEALYLDIIPIVWNSSLNVLYEDLPVVIINDENELNANFLYENLKTISAKKLQKMGGYDYKKLRNSYWRRLILEKSRHNNFSTLHERKGLCWQARRTGILNILLKILYY